MPDREALSRRYARVRARTEALAAPLSAEDAMVQSMPDASPAKWHLAHTTWFFDEFVLARHGGGHRWHDERWRVLYNSYYEAVGPRHARPARGVLSRPSLDEVRAWRARVDEGVLALLKDADAAALDAVLLGTHHEEQHQELLLTDVQHAFFSSELRPAYTERPLEPSAPGSMVIPVMWAAFDESLVDLGHAGDGFAFDNETPRHRALVGAFRLASRLVTNGEYRDFIADGGYERSDLWLADGWTAVHAGAWRSPLYWDPGGERAFGMRGMQALDPRAPVAQVSFYEADAFARWAGARLPTEAEWERAARDHAVDGTFVDGGRLATAPAAGEGTTQLFGDAWQWTASAYLPYPRFRPLEGALGEYNGKFMSGQMVLRGGSCFSPREHLRATYRNFFPPHARWQVSGIRLARDA